MFYFPSFLFLLSLLSLFSFFHHNFEHPKEKVGNGCASAGNNLCLTSIQICFFLGYFLEKAELKMNGSRSEGANFLIRGA